MQVGIEISGHARRFERLYVELNLGMGMDDAAKIRANPDPNNPEPNNRRPIARTAPVFVKPPARYYGRLRYLTPSRSERIHAKVNEILGYDRQMLHVLFCGKLGRAPVAGHVTNMYQRSVAYKGFLIYMVLFCAYMQWSPVVDLDYVWINGHEHYVGAASPHQADTVAVPNVTQAGGGIVEDFAPLFQPLRLSQFATRLAPPATPRL